MTEQSNNDKRDDVLFAFHRACLTPTDDEVADWAKRYPEFAEDIRIHAEIRNGWAQSESSVTEEVDETLLSRGRSRALNAVFHASQSNSGSVDNVDVSFNGLMGTAQTSTPQLARELDIDRSVLADLFRGRMRPPIGSRLVSALLEKLRTTHATFECALNNAMSAPTMGLAKANGKPKVIQRTYEEVIRSSGMTEERKTYWLGE